MSAEDSHSASQSQDRLVTDPDTHSVHSKRDAAQHPIALAEALKAVHRTPDTPSDSNSDSGIESPDAHPHSVLLRRKSGSDSYDNSASDTPEILHLDRPGLDEKPSSEQFLRGVPRYTSASSGKKTYVVASDDAELREILRRGLERATLTSSQEKEKGSPGRREKLRDMVFTRQFSAFDRQNQAAANSPFHGFYVLFWISVFFLIVKMAAENWRKTGNPLGTNEIMKAMFRRDDTVFFVLHGLVMLMKQHSYAFYNGHLSSVYKKRQSLLLKLKQLENVSPVTSPSQTNPRASAVSTSHLAFPPSADEYHERRLSLSKAGSTDQDDMERISHAIETAEPLDVEQLHVFERLIKWEVDALADELRGKATDPTHYYPNNLTFLNHYEYIVLPTVVYELQYPRSDSINWYYVAEKACALFGVIFVMIMISQAFIYPVVMRTIRMKEMGWSTAERFREFPWLLSDLAFPFMMEYMLAWYLIWETVLNILAELTFFADRSFYDAWWNSVSWDQYARDWNRPVHNFLLRHVYHSSISSMRVNKHTATLITFFLSACVHELVMWCIFKKLRGYLLILQMFQLPLVRLSRTKWLRGQATIGNIMFWVGIFTGPSDN
ncbi:hypothetical protein Daesc_007446 [Daldinia eschscholtzii]|uniref:O-acyltransferase n=1 Tax=Daldinia eschscholtzii TaxID=292717 RepID=A0AAX6MDZ7_9PEZI